MVDRVAIVAEVARSASGTFKTLEHDSCDVKVLWSLSLYMLLVYIVDNIKIHTQYKNNMFSSGGKGDMGGGWKQDTERGRQGGPATCDRSQVRLGTRFALNEDEETTDNEAALTTRGVIFMQL